MAIYKTTLITWLLKYIYGINRRIFHFSAGTYISGAHTIYLLIQPVSVSKSFVFTAKQNQARQYFNRLCENLNVHITLSRVTAFTVMA